MSNLTLRQIITTALIELGVNGEGNPAPEAYDADRGVKAFNAMWTAYQGRVIGQRLSRDWNASAGQEACAGGLYAVSILTPQEPANGTRIGVIGARTVTASDGTIEGASSVTTTESATWFYREDLADWVKEEDLTLDDEHPFSTELNESLPFMLAVRMAGRFGAEISPQIAAGNTQGMAQMRQLYKAQPGVRVDSALLRGVGRLGLC